MTVKQYQTNTQQQMNKQETNAMFQKLRDIGCTIKGDVESFSIDFPEDLNPTLLEDQTIPQVVRDTYDFSNVKNRPAPSVTLISNGRISEVM